MKVSVLLLALSVAMLLLMVTCTATFHAIERSQDRTACYRAGHAQCGERDVIERAVAWFLDTHSTFAEEPKR